MGVVGDFCRKLYEAYPEGVPSYTLYSEETLKKLGVSIGTLRKYMNALSSHNFIVAKRIVGRVDWYWSSDFVARINNNDSGFLDQLQIIKYKLRSAPRMLLFVFDLMAGHDFETTELKNMIGGLDSINWTHSGLHSMIKSSLSCGCLKRIGHGRYSFTELGRTECTGQLWLTYMERFRKLWLETREAAFSMKDLERFEITPELLAFAESRGAVICEDNVLAFSKIGLKIFGEDKPSLDEPLSPEKKPPKPLYEVRVINLSQDELCLSQNEKWIFDWLVKNKALCGDAGARVNESWINLVDECERDDFLKKLLQFKVITLVGEGKPGRIFQIDQSLGATLKVRILSERDERIVQLSNKVDGWRATVKTHEASYRRVVDEIAGLRQRLDELLTNLDKVHVDQRTAVYCLAKAEIELDQLRSK